MTHKLITIHQFRYNYWGKRKCNIKLQYKNYVLRAFIKFICY